MMSPSVPPSHPLGRLFTGLVEHVFHVDIGVCDPEVTDYLSNLLLEFVHVDRIFALRDARGRRIEEIAEMVTEAQLDPPVSRDARDRLVHKHIGDFTLFWTGVYPEGLRRLRSPSAKDHLVDYLRQGKRSYAIASNLSNRTTRPPADVLRRLSDRFEYCVYGLGLVRKNLDRIRPDPATPLPLPPLD